MAPLLEVRDIRKVFRVYAHPRDRLKEIFLKKKLHHDFVANDGITFFLERGETLGIVGLNGAGKSTLLKLIAGVLEPSAGEVIRRGRVTALLELGTGFNPRLSGYDNIFLNGELIGMSPEEIRERLSDIVEFSELGPFIDEPVKTYSSGMVMRLAFSIAIHSNPEILIVDEALSVGDAHFSAKCTRALRQRKEEAMSILYVSHDLNSLKLLCDRMILLNDGRIEAEGDPESVLNTYNYLIARLDDENFTREVEGRRHEYGTFEARIESVKLWGVDSRSEVLSSGEEAEILVSYRTREDLEDLTIGIAIRDRFGQDLYGTNTFYLGASHRVRAGERYRCRFRLPMNLGPGRYYLTVALHSQHEHTEHCYHWIDRAVEFEVAGIRGPLFTGLCRLETRIACERFPERKGERKK